MSEIITVTGTVEEIIYSNPDNGYSVVGIDSVEEGQFTATGYMPFITEVTNTIIFTEAPYLSLIHI